MKSESLHAKPGWSLGKLDISTPLRSYHNPILLTAKQAALGTPFAPSLMRLTSNTSLLSQSKRFYHSCCESLAPPFPYWFHWILAALPSPGQHKLASTQEQYLLN